MGKICASNPIAQKSRKRYYCVLKPGPTRGVLDVHCTGAMVRGPLKVKVRMISFSVMKPRIISVSQLPV